MDGELVSVIIPTFNRAYCLARTLDSVLAQTHAELEVLVIDDGSTDDTMSLVQTRYGQDARVRYIHQANCGVAGARNTGIVAASGDFVALLDSDDVWQPWKIELQVACLRQYPQLGMVWTDMEAIDPSGQVFDAAYLRRMYSAYRFFSMGELFSASHALAGIAPSLSAVVKQAQLHTGMIFSQMIMGSLVHTSTVLLRRERLDRVGLFNEGLRYSGEDYDFHLRTCRLGPVGFVDLPAIQYQRGMPDRLTRDEYRIHTATNFLNTIAPLIVEARAEIHLPQRMLDTVLADAHLWVGEVHFDMNEMAGARSQFQASLGHKLLQPQALLLYLASFIPTTSRGWLRLAYRAFKRRLLRRGRA